VDIDRSRMVRSYVTGAVLALAAGFDAVVRRVCAD
jgi:hypothetical protein